MKCKACEVAETRSLLKVNEDLCNERNAGIRLLVNFLAHAVPIILVLIHLINFKFTVGM